MAFKHYNLTLTGAAQRLSSALTVTTAGGIDDVPCRAIILQADSANAGVMYFGMSTVASNSYAFSIEIPSGSVPAPPFVLGEFDQSGPLKLSDFYVIGTTADILHIGIVPY